jgi:prephenate dehydratase
MRIAYQGEPGAFGEMAARIDGGRSAVLLPMYTFEDVVTAVMAGEVERGILPVANSIIGTVPAGAAAAATPGLSVLRRVEVPVQQCLMALPGTTIETITRVISHPAALGQCHRFFTAHPHVTPTEWYDTAGAAKHVASHNDLRIAAIASRRAAEHYGLQVLAADIQDRQDNVTEFVVVESGRSAHFTQSRRGAEAHT